jgi:uncharacterized protein (UPF0548 family)
LIRLFRRPSALDVDAALGASHEHSYPEVGASAQLGTPALHARLAPRYAVDVYEFPLGTGRAVFERAREALAEWRHFEIPWLELHRDGPVARGQVVATLTRVAGVWFLNPCRVVYAELAPGGSEAAFAYGTLRGHVVAGEERFRVSLDPASGAVTYQIAAFSRPAAWLTQLGRPWLRRVQRRFAAASAKALARATS